MKIRLLVFLILFSLLLSLHAAEMPPSRVKVARVAEESVAPTTKIVGTLYFERISRVAAEEGARVRQVTFKEGDTVNVGSTLVKLDTSILQEQLALETARLKQVEFRIKNAKRNLDRMTHLLKNNAVTESAWDDLMYQHEELLQEKVALTRQQEILRIRLGKTVIKAPFNGLILNKQVEVGEWVGPGSALCVLAASEALYVQVPVAEELVRFTKKGDRLSILLNAYNRSITGVMEGIRPIADPRTKNVSLKVKLDYTGPVAENMSATVEIPISEPGTVTTLPRDALVQFQGMDMVYVVNEGKVQSLPVEIISSMADRIGIKAQNLAPGDLVVVEGNERLRPGQPVEVIGE